MNDLKFKPASTTIEVTPIRDLCIVKGTGKCSIVTLSNIKTDEGAEFEWTLIAYGESAVMDSCPLKIGDRVMLESSPKKRFNLPSNEISFDKLSNFYRDMAKEDREGFAGLIKEMPKVEIAEYFIVNSYEIAAIKNENYKEEVIVNKSGLII